MRNKKKHLKISEQELEYKVNDIMRYHTHSFRYFYLEKSYYSGDEKVCSDIFKEMYLIKIKEAIEVLKEVSKFKEHKIFTDIRRGIKSKSKMEEVIKNIHNHLLKVKEMYREDILKKTNNEIQANWDRRKLSRIIKVENTGKSKKRI